MVVWPQSSSVPHPRIQNLPKLLLGREERSWSLWRRRAEDPANSCGTGDEQCARSAMAAPRSQTAEEKLVPLVV